jgi:glyoxylase-like metal-dependent hydrolase (beta-lactamase superfamily II)
VSDHSIWLLEYGYVDRFPASNLFAAQPFEGFRRMSYCFGLIRSRERCILVDTGFWDEERHRLLTAKYGETLWQPPTEVVRRAGVEPSDVDTIVLTHNDFDHAGCVTAFPDAHVVVQREEMERYAAAAALPPRFAFLTNVAQKDLPETLAARDATLVDGEAALVDGIRLVPAFGTHTPGSQYVVVDNDADGRWIFAGDLVYVYENVEGLRGDGVMAPIAMTTGSHTTWLHVVAALVDSVDGETNRVLPFHDTAAWARFDSREYDDGLHVAEVTLAGGHASVLQRVYEPANELE